MNEIKNKKEERDLPSDQFIQVRMNRQGFTLVELLISVFIFSLVMITVTALFSRFVVYQKRSKAIQQNMEDARYAMELMAKTLRTSSIISCNNTANPTCVGAINSLEIYEYSQRKCIKYEYSGQKIRQALSGQVADIADCTAGVFTGMTANSIVNNEIINMNFFVTKSSSGEVGRVTISAVICSNIGCSGTENDRATLQTTVSLRDYIESNP